MARGNAELLWGAHGNNHSFTNETKALSHNAGL
jgi:hypothetical protein